MLQKSMRCIIMHLKAKIATGSWLKPAERRLSGLDPEPDLDNANVGIYIKQLMGCACGTSHISF